MGQADGKVSLFLNIGTDAEPTFDGGTFLQVGLTGSKTDIDVGYRATLAVVDWNNDGKKDLLAGATDAKIRIYLNEGADHAPDFRSVQFAQNYGADLSVPPSRSSPVVADLDGDGKKDLLTGNYYGQLLFYRNTGTDAVPSFSGYSSVESDGAPIDLSGSPRSRPSVCDWTDDGVPDVLIGAGDGKVHLYPGVRAPGDFDGDGNVDLDDYAEFPDCLSGPWQGASFTEPAQDCLDAFDFDTDTDVDLKDCAEFQKVLAE